MGQVLTRHQSPTDWVTVAFYTLVTAILFAWGIFATVRDWLFGATNILLP